MALPNDISRCINKECDLRLMCARWLDWPKDGSVVSVIRFKNENNNCENFIKNEK